MKRRASTVGTSPSYTAHVTETHRPPTEPHEPRCSDFAAHPGFVKHSTRSESEAQHLGFPSARLVDHGATPRPTDTATQDRTVHMAMDTLALGHHWNSLAATDVFITPPASRALAHGAFGTLESLPVLMKTVPFPRK